MVRSTVSLQYFSSIKKEMQKMLGIKQFSPKKTQKTIFYFYFFLLLPSQENFKKGHQRETISTEI